MSGRVVMALFVLLPLSGAAAADDSKDGPIVAPPTVADKDGAGLGTPSSDRITKDEVVPFTHEQLQALRIELRERFPDHPEFRTDLDRMERYFDGHADARLKQPTYPKADVVLVRQAMGDAVFPFIKKIFVIQSKRLPMAEAERQIEMARDQLHAQIQEIAQKFSARMGNSGDVTSDALAKILKESDVVKLARESVSCTMRRRNCEPSNGGSGSQPSGGSSSGSGGAAPNQNGGAAPSWESLIDVTPSGQADLLAQHGGAELDQGQLASARADAREALRLDPENKEAQAVFHLAEEGNGATVGSLMASAGRAALSDGENAPPAAADASGALGRSSSILPTGETQKGIQNALGLGDLAGAMSLANRALAQDPGNPALLNLRATVYARARDYDHAIGDAKAGLALAPKNPTLGRVLGYAQLRGGKYKDALATANGLIAEDPRDAYAYALRAHAEGNLGDRDAMMSDLRRAAALDPRFARTLAQAGALRLPSTSDLLFLFPGEAAPGGAPAGAAGPERGRRFLILLIFCVIGGLLVALGLLHVLFAGFQEKAAAAMARLTRRGPRVGLAGSSRDKEGLIQGQYEISRPIGSGGMGTVFEGTDRFLGRRVAIKKMRGELRQDPRERQRFVAEARTVAALHHPNIVDIFSIADDGEDVYLIFEFVDGKTVHELVQSRGRLRPEEAAPILRAAADALGYAHARGIIHRDVKPSNIMVDASGTVKVMDFGIARAAQEALTRRALTNTILGTPPYMAPEQEQGNVRRESDVYSLAVCAYEMLCGRLPFAGSNGGMLLNKINMSFVPPSRETPGLPAALDPVFRRAFQADPDKRWHAPLEFTDALNAVL